MDNIHLEILESERLILEPLHESDQGFMYSLLNSPGWLEFIGDRKIKTLEDATQHIRKINGDANINYWVARLRTDGAKLGVITFVKRTYLDHFDIGFAMLPQYAGYGYALEGARIVLEHAFVKGGHPAVLGTVLAKNNKSIRLLERLGLSFEREITVDGVSVLLYAASK